MVPENTPDEKENQQTQQEADQTTIQDAANEIPIEGADPSPAAQDSETDAGGSEGLAAELAQAKEDLMRAQAEVQNVRRRAQLDVEKAHKFGQEKLVTDLLAVVDNLERALASINVEDDGTKAIVEGVELTLKSLTDTLQRHNVEAINPEGEPFDPALHQAMTAVESADLEPNTVMDVFQKGYTLHGRLIRPAMVVVSKAPISETSK